jgi:hypothetical protein
MSQSAYIRFVTGSAISTLTLEELKQQLLSYKDQLAKTGSQLDWEYDEAGFPYSIESKPEGEGKWFYLKGKNALYRYLLLGIGAKEAEEEGAEPRSYVQITLPDDATHGDKSKGNELCKHLARLWKAELQLFNGRVMFFNPRK